MIKVNHKRVIRIEEILWMNVYISLRQIRAKNSSNLNSNVEKLKPRAIKVIFIQIWDKKKTISFCKRKVSSKKYKFISLPLKSLGYFRIIYVQTACI